MTQSDLDALGSLVGLFILVITVVWIMTRDDDFFDGGW